MTDEREELAWKLLLAINPQINPNRSPRWVNAMVRAHWLALADVAISNAYGPAILKWQDEWRDMQAQRDALATFKAYVHKRLDDAGIPTHPDGPHSAAGCRVGDRLDILIAERDAKVKEIEAVKLTLQQEAAEWLRVGGRDEASAVNRAAAAAIRTLKEPKA